MRPSWLHGWPLPGATGRDSWSAGWGVSSLRKELAALSGDVNAHVAVLAQEARSGRDFGEIVSVLRAAGRDREAEERARKGLAAEPLSPRTDALREQLAELLLGSGRGDEAFAMYRDVFERRSPITFGSGRLPSGRDSGRSYGLGAGFDARAGVHGRADFRAAPRGPGGRGVVDGGGPAGTTTSARGTPPGSTRT
jgi:hypothetical protein